MSRLRTTLAVGLVSFMTVSMAACSSDSGDENTNDGGAAAGKEITVSHAQGETTLTTNPEKVVVLDFGILDTLDALEVDSVVGLAKQGAPDFLDEYAGDDYEDVGTMQEPDIEKIAEIDPDVILIGGRSAAKYAELNEIAPTIDLTVGSDDFMTSFEEVSTTIGEIFEKTDEVEEKLADIDESIEQTKADAEGAGNALIVLVSGGKLSAFGPGSRFGFVHDVLGVPAASPDLQVDRHGQAISNEFIADTNPQHLFVVDRDSAIGQESGQSAEQVLDNDLVKGTDAAKNDKITYLDGQRWYVVGAGLNNVPEMIDEVASAIK